MAPGATSGSLAGTVLREGLSRTVAGLVIGLAAAALATGALRALLFDVAPLEAESL